MSDFVSGIALAARTMKWDADTHVLREPMLRATGARGKVHAYLGEQLVDLSSPKADAGKRVQRAAPERNGRDSWRPRARGEDRVCLLYTSDAADEL